MLWFYTSISVNIYRSRFHTCLLCFAKQNAPHLCGQRRLPPYEFLKQNRFCFFISLTRFIIACDCLMVVTQLLYKKYNGVVLGDKKIIYFTNTFFIIVFSSKMITHTRTYFISFHPFPVHPNFINIKKDNYKPLWSITALIQHSYHYTQSKNLCISMSDNAGSRIFNVSIELYVRKVSLCISSP